MSIKKSKPDKKKVFKYLNLKNLLFIISGLILTFYSARIIFKPNISQYPALNSCFVSTVHKVLLCDKSSKYVNLNQISNYFIHSVLISEDDSFYLHQGIDWIEFKNSFIQNLKLKRFSRGGSTITQQLVKNIYLSQNKSLIRKFKEILLAQQIEKKYAKSVILEKYLNVIELGTDIYGVKEAASFYFKKTPANLNILESIYLTTLLPNPKLYSKSFFNKQLPGWQSERIEILLKRLLRRKRISDNLYQTALAKIHMFPWTQIELLDYERPIGENLDFLDNLDQDPVTPNSELESEKLKKSFEEPTDSTNNNLEIQNSENKMQIDNIDTNEEPFLLEKNEETDDLPVDTSDPDF